MVSASLRPLSAMCAEKSEGAPQNATNFGIGTLDCGRIASIQYDGSFRHVPSNK
jgi:hypothetical protein